MIAIRRSLAIAGLFAAWALGSGGSGFASGAEEKVRVLIVDGQNNHNWRAMTPPMKAELEQSGRFTVDVATTPGRKSKPSAWDAFHPDFSKYDVVLSNYNGEPWPAEVRKTLEDYVANGGGLAIIHAANNAFPDWPAFNEMIGLGWRGPEFRRPGDGGRQAAHVVRTPKGQGPGSGHGPPHAYRSWSATPSTRSPAACPRSGCTPRTSSITASAGRPKHMQILATAYSDKAKGGTAPMSR